MTLRAQLLAGCGLSIFTLAASAADLLDVYQRALQSDPVIRAADANRLATLEAKPQARAALLPLITTSGAIGKSESDGSSAFVSSIGQNAGTLTRDISTDTDTFWQYRIQLTQTIFRWDRWATLKRADKQVAQAEIDYKAAQQDLIGRVARRYFDVLAAKDTVEAAQATLEAVSRQLEQADKRFEVGLIAITDVQDARAGRDQASAATIAAKRTLATSQEFLRELTGEAFPELATIREDMPLQTPDPATEDRWVQAALEQNLRLISARLATDIAKQDVSIARAGHSPTFDIVASHTASDREATQTIVNPPTLLEPDGFRSVQPADSDLTEDQIALQVTFPIYAGGGTSSEVRQRVYLHRAARERMEQAARETERQARDAYLGVLSEISRVQALRQAVESTRTALQANEAGFEVGTRTTVDVLDARRRLFEAQTNYSRSRYDYIVNILTLKFAAGTLSMADLQEINGWLQK